MLRITELRLPLDHDEGALRAAVLARLGLADADLRALNVFRRAWDARKKTAVVLSYTVDCTLAGEKIARGDRLYLSYPSGNRDEAELDRKSVV